VDEILNGYPLREILAKNVVWSCPEMEYFEVVNVPLERWRAFTRKSEWLVNILQSI